MKETSTQKLRLGLFVIVGTVVFVLAIYFIGNKQNLFGSTVQIHALFNNVNGLQPGNNVRYSGIDIGTVRGIEMINDTAIRVNMDIDRKIAEHLRTDAVATISSDGLVGSMVLNIIPGSGNGKPVQDGDAIGSYSRIRTEDMLKTLTVTNENAALLTADLLKITHQINEGKGSVGMLLKDEKVATDIRETMQNLKISSQETAASMKKINALVSDLDKKDNTIGVLRDSSVAHQLRRTIAKLERSGDDLSNAIRNLDSVVEKVKNGRGAVHYLTADPSSAHKIDSVITNVNDATKLLKQDLEALKHSFLLRGYFKKQEKAKKQNK